MRLQGVGAGLRMENPAAELMELGITGTCLTTRGLVGDAWNAEVPPGNADFCTSKGHVERPISGRRACLDPTTVQCNTAHVSRTTAWRLRTAHPRCWRRALLEERTATVTPAAHIPEGMETCWEAGLRTDKDKGTPGRGVACSLAGSRGSAGARRTAGL